MKVRIKDCSGYYTNIYGWKEGMITEVLIHEFQPNNKNSWYLIPTTNVVSDVHDSTEEVINGEIKRLYTKPGFEFNRRGKYMWIECQKCEVLHENNRAAAKILLEKYEWRV